MQVQTILHLVLATFILVKGSSADLPTVTLPWGTWQANHIDHSSQSLVFQNIRFGQPPTGKLRFQRPLRPDAIPNNQTRMDNTYGPSCHQVVIPDVCDSPLPVGLQSEDCLFLDIYVPLSVWKNAREGKVETPVVVWIYGGGFIEGAKTAYAPDIPFYNGSGLLKAARLYDEEFIFVTGNYRTGAFGWLAGNVIEAEATPNAGLYDQRLLFEWVRDYIHLFGGNRNKVSAWGESAGGSSIMYHLMREDGAVDPLFRRVFVQSPAYQWSWDRSRNGSLDQTFNNFTKFSNCAEGDFECLVDQDESVLVKANQELFNNDDVGIFPVGPSVDGHWVRSLPDVAYSQGRIWKDIETMAISHMGQEAQIFVPDIKDATAFTAFVDRFFPEPQLADLRAAIGTRYQAQWWETDRQRANRVLGDLVFYCNTRTMFNAYSNLTNTKVYMMSNQFFGDADGSLHATDVIAAFNTTGFDIAKYLEQFLCETEAYAETYANSLKSIAPVYQSYLADLAVWGNPNKHEKKVLWPVATTSSNGNVVEKALFVNTDDFSVGPDYQNLMSVCEFWNRAQADIDQLFGKAVERLPVLSDLDQVPLSEGL